MTTSDATPSPIKNQALRIYFPILTAAEALVTGWTGTTGAASISKDGGNYATTGSNPTEIQTSGTGFLDLTSTEMNADCVVIKVVVSNATATPAIFVIPTNDLTKLQTNAVYWKGSALGTPATSGVPDINVKNINNVAATSVTTVNANVGTTQPTNFTGTGASALVKSDTVDIAGTAVNTASVQVGVNVVSYASGQAPLQPTTAGRTLDVAATGEAGLDYDNIKQATGATTLNNITVPTVTTTGTATNLTNAPTNGDFTTTMKTSLNAATPTVTLADGAITAAKFAAAAITSTVLAANAITSSIIADGAITATKFATGAFTAASLDAAAVAALAAGVWGALQSAYNVAGTMGAAMNLITSIWNRLLSNITNLVSNVAANGTITIYQYRDSGNIDIPLNTTIDVGDTFALYIGKIGENNPQITVVPTYLTASSVRVTNITAAQAATVTNGNADYEVKRTSGGLNYQVATGRCVVEQVVKQ